MARMQIDPRALRMDEKVIIEVGSRMWPWTFGAGMREVEVAGAIMDRVDDGADPSRTEREIRGQEQDLSFAVCWANAGYPKIVFSHEKFAAALLCTRAELSLDDLPMPWTAFVVVLPRGLIATDLGDFYRIHVWSFMGSCHIATFNDQALMCSVNRTSWGELLLEKSECMADLPSWTERDERIAGLARRAVVGALYSLAHTNNFKDRDRALGGRSSMRDGPPKHRIVMIGRPIGVDARKAVRAYAMGSASGLPSVQSLVRGHYKRQVIGVARSGRKVIWIEPYWRGPEDAPILARPYKVGAA